jgi:hypothetical protein
LNLSSQNSPANGALSVVGQLEVLRLAARSRFPLRLDRGEGQGVDSIHIQSIASRSREIAADIQEIA